MEIEKPLVARVVSEEHFGRPLRRTPCERCLHTALGGERNRRAGFDIDARRAPVLVSIMIAEEHDVPVVPGPYETAGDRAIGGAGDWPRLPNVVDGRDPQVENAVKRRAPGEPGAVRAEAKRPALGIFEEETPGDNRVWRFVGKGYARNSSCHEQRKANAAKRGCPAQREAPTIHCAAKHEGPPVISGHHIRPSDTEDNIC